MKLKLNKKGIIDNFLALLVVTAIIIVIFGILFVFMPAKTKANNAAIASDLNINEGLYTTRIVLSTEVPQTVSAETASATSTSSTESAAISTASASSTKSSTSISSTASPSTGLSSAELSILTDYKVYDALIDAVNSGSNEKFKEQLYESIKTFYPNGEITDKWLVIINENCFVIAKRGATSSEVVAQSGSQFGQYAGMSAQLVIDECEQGLIDKMPKVTVPNPDGENILVLFKPVSSLDGQTSRSFGYRADQKNGISSGTISGYSVDGKELEEISDIPNIVCDASDTSVGKICISDSSLVQQLRVLSVNKLQPEGIKITINQAYRTYEIQKRLYDKNCNADGCTTITCNPSNSVCPHMQAGAIDINMYDSKGNSLSASEVEKIMCEYGFVRYSKETWHFEYGTYQWTLAEEKRANGEKACTY